MLKEVDPVKENLHVLYSKASERHRMRRKQIEETVSSLVLVNIFL